MKKQCRRRIWKLVNPINHVLEGIQPTQGPKLDKLRMMELASIEAFRTGSATVQDWAHLTNMLNVCENMATSGIGPEALPVCKEAHKHLLEAALRFNKTRKMGFTGAGLQTMRELYEYHDLQRTSVSLGEYEKAIRDTEKRIKSAAPEVTRVLEAA